MADMCDHLREFMVEGTKLNEAKLKENIERSVMMVTALSPVIGYDKAAAISHYAIDHDQTLKQAALANGVSEDLFDKVVIPRAHPPRHRRLPRPAGLTSTCGSGTARRAGRRAALIASVGGRGARPTGPTRTTGCGGCWPSSSAWPG